MLSLCPPVATKEVSVPIEGLRLIASATIPVRGMYVYDDLKVIADQAMHVNNPLRTVDGWIEQAGIVRRCRTARTSIYREGDVLVFLMYLTFKLNYGRRQAFPAFCEYVS